MTVRLDIEYVGTRFSGWATQRDKRTVQGEVERALAQVLQTPTPVRCAGRTDAGVHAWGQVASYEGPLVPLRALNALTPRDVAVLAVSEAPDGFDARRWARSRSYRYRVLHRRAGSARHGPFVLHWPGRLDPDVLHACAQALVGTHDFTAFTPTETVHVRFERRVSHASWTATPEHEMHFRITADSFLRSMNRVLVGTMLEVASGGRSFEDFVGLLGGAHRRDAGHTAAPQGLALEHVDYGPEPWGPTAWVSG